MNNVINNLEKPIVIEKYGVELKQLTHEKIEMLRQYRNSMEIQQYMEYREEITPEMQETWFQRVDNSGKDFYFIIEFDKKEIGCINIKNVNFDTKEGEPGIFIWTDDFLGTDVPSRASMALSDFAWDVLKLDRQVIHVLRNNQRAITYNKQMGYKLSPNQQDVINQEYILTHEDSILNNRLHKLRSYFEKTNK